MNCPQIVGVLNVTSDSFFDGGLYQTVSKAIDKALAMERAGVDWIDIGAESTRPGGVPLSEKEELQRLESILPKLLSVIKIPVSIDTMKASVAEWALSLGVSMVNDVSALRFDKNMVDVLRRTELPFVLMHSPMEYLQERSSKSYGVSCNDIVLFFEERLRFCEEKNLSRDRVILDPGIGFGKDLKDNLAILADLDRWRSLGCDLFFGLSRKRFIRELLHNIPSEDMLTGTLFFHAWLIFNGVQYLRVHDVSETLCFRELFSQWKSFGLRGALV